ncbi:hypothetical protein B1R94_01230 [Mycolicibacterium litorale]|nr:hypothetical protein B1R94_01230 [Mycolicibacterium litorale]
MFNSVQDGGFRRTRQGRAQARNLIAATAVAAAAAVGLASTEATVPAARADGASTINITVDPTFTAGIIAGLLDVLGVDDIPIPINQEIPVPIIGPITIGTLELVLHNVPSNPASIYNAINGYSGWSTTGSTRYRFPATVGIGNGAFDLVNAYRAQLDSVHGNTPSGYTPFVPGPGGQVNFTSQVLIYGQNPYRPNGGILTRFGPLLNLFGVDTTLPPVGRHTDATGKIVLNTATLDLTWAYDPLSDFPVTLNPFSLANSALAALPTNLLGGVEIDPAFQEQLVDAGLNIAGTLGVLYNLSGGVLTPPDGQAWYATLIPKDLPLLEPLRLPVRVINAVSSLIGHPLNLGTPLADALQPALSILVNTGYTDVRTPTDGGTYNRTFDQSATDVPFLSQAPLTPAEWAQVPGDVVRALIVGFQDSFPVLRFGQPAPTLVVDGNHLAISYDSTPVTAGATVPTAAAAPDASTEADSATPAVPKVATSGHRSAVGGAVQTRASSAASRPGAQRTTSRAEVHRASSPDSTSKASASARKSTADRSATRSGR